LSQRLGPLILNLYTIMGLGFLALTAMAYVEHEYRLAVFYLLIGGALLLGKVSVLFPHHKLARVFADIGVVFLALNTLMYYGFRTVNVYTLVTWVILLAALVEALYVAKKL